MTDKKWNCKRLCTSFKDCHKPCSLLEFFLEDEDTKLREVPIGELNFLTSPWDTVKKDKTKSLFNRKAVADLYNKAGWRVRELSWAFKVSIQSIYNAINEDKTEPPVND